MDDVIYTYTRAQALADGVLVDVTEAARRVGFRWPVALTEVLMAQIEASSLTGRLEDVLWLAYLAIKRGDGDGTTLFYRMLLPTATQQVHTLKLVSGPGDDLEPVITIMLAHED